MHQITALRLLLLISLLRGLFILTVSENSGIYFSTGAQAFAFISTDVQTGSTQQASNTDNNSNHYHGDYSQEASAAAVTVGYTKGG